MLVLSLAFILLAASIFTNGVEVLGNKLKWHQGAVGSILAAVGTAMPETLIPIIAIMLYQDPKADEVGIGAIAGAPFMLGTLAFFVTGVAVVVYGLLGRRSFKMTIDPAVLKRDLVFFLCLYGAAVLATFVHETVVLKDAIGIALLLSYGWYVKCTLRSDGQVNEALEPLLMTRIFKVNPRFRWALFQVLAALAIMVLGAHMFVGYVTDLSLTLGVPALILSIIITPIATELPEKFNSVIWIGKKKDVLALGNLTGAMVFQSSFPVVFGVCFTHWDLMKDNGITMASAILALASAAMVLAWVKIKGNLNPYVLMTCGLFYAAFVVYIVTHSAI
jgi:cation:H+ antiporter